MSIACKEIIEVIEKFAPTELAESWDNVGLICGDPEQPVSKVLFALDLTALVCEEAVKNNFDLIITHHPPIFKSIKSITTSHPMEKMLMTLIKNDISVYAAHTNFDATEGGVNDVLAEKLNLRNVKVMLPNPQFPTCGLGRIGEVRDSISLLYFAEFVREVLGFPPIRVVGDFQKKITKVAVSSGSGSNVSDFATAKSMGADVFVTGDIKFHDAQAALEMGLCLIDATHYATEVFGIFELCNYLKKEISNISFCKFEKEEQPFKQI